MLNIVTSRLIILLSACIIYLSVGIAFGGEAGLNVLDFGAKPDGVTDCTSAIQSALDEAGKTGAVVTIPQGQYSIKGMISIPEGVTLEGVWKGPHTSQLNKGTVLFAYAGRDKEDSTPFISLHSSSTIKGVTIFYPEQKVKDIRPYPWTIQGRGQHYSVIDVTIVNAYNGIDCGTYHNEGHHLRNVYMCALRRGVFIDQCTDIGRLENVHIHSVYWWRVGDPYRLTGDDVDVIRKFSLANLEGFIIGRTDWQYISNCFVFWPKVGFRFILSKAGAANALITQSGSDEGPLAVKVETVQKHAGIAFENCQIMAGIEVDSQNEGPIKFTNCGFWGRSATGNQLILNGDNTTTLTACHFTQWESGKPCIIASNGSLMMTMCDFNQLEGEEKPSHIILQDKLKSAIITGNRFQQKPGIVNKSKGDVLIEKNVKF